MRPSPAIAMWLLVCLSMEGCSAARELPRSELADLPEQRDVTVEMRNGQRLDFDTARFGADSLWGFRHGSEGDSSSVVELSTTALPLADVERVSARRLDWYRTGLAGLAVLGSGVAYAVSQRKSKPTDDGTPAKPPPVLAGARRR